MLKTFTGMILLALITPLLLILYTVSFLGIVSSWLFEIIYEPIYNMAGKPFDKNKLKQKTNFMGNRRSVNSMELLDLVVEIERYLSSNDIDPSDMFVDELLSKLNEDGLEDL